MKHIVSNLNSRGLPITATFLEQELKVEDIDTECLKANAKGLTALANKLSATGFSRYKSHAKTILKIVDELNNIQ